MYIIHLRGVRNTSLQLSRKVPVRVRPASVALDVQSVSAEQSRCSGQVVLLRPKQKVNIVIVQVEQKDISLFFSEFLLVYRCHMSPQLWRQELFSLIINQSSSRIKDCLL